MDLLCMVFKRTTIGTAIEMSIGSIIGTTPASTTRNSSASTSTSTSTAYPRLLDLSYSIFERTSITTSKDRSLNCVSDMNSKKNSKIPFKLAKNKRKISKKSVEKKLNL